MSAITLVLRLAALIFAAEILIMIVGSSLHDEYGGHWSSTLGLALADGALLVVISGTAIYYWVVTPYVRARDKAEHALRESEERFRQMAESISEVFWMSDPEKTEILYVSPAYEKVWGRSCQSVYDDALSIVDPIHPDDRERVVAAFERQATGQYDEEYRLIRPDGSLRHIRDRAFPVRDEGGRVYRIVGIAEDVTETKRSEEALRNSEERLRSIIENSPDSIVLKDREGRFQLVNRNFLERYGASEAEVLGRTEHEVHPKEVADIYAAQHRKVVETGRIVRGDLTVPFADSSGHILVVTRFPVFDNERRIVGVGSISADVTEQRQAEQQLREAQKMETIGRIVGGVAHEFNNLLMVILGNIELLKERLEGHDEQCGLAETIERVALRGGSLTQQLLAYSRRQQLLPRPSDVNQHITSMETILGPSLGETIELELRLGDDLGVTKIDPGQLQNALLNLVINARDAMPEGGRLSIETSNARLEAADVAHDPDREPGEYVVVTVRDAGHGMTAEVVQRVFDPFFTTKEVGEGTGLGLSMVHGFARQSGGFVEVASAPGQGTTVRLYLPRVAEDTVAPEEAEPGQQPPKGTETVLVAEDEEEVLRLVCRLLKSLGYEVLAARSGEEALAVLREGRCVDLLFTDVVMPGGMSGLDLAERARRFHPALKVLFTTGYSDTGGGGCERFGPGTRLIAKPYRTHELAQAVRQIMGSAAARV